MNFEDITTEKEIIGNILNDHTAYMEVFDILNPAHFSDHLLGKVYQTYGQQVQKKEPTDLLTLSHLTGAKGAELAECMEHGWMSANVKMKARKVIGLSHKRDTYQHCRKLVAEMPTLTSAEIAKRLSDMAAAVAINNQTKHIYDGRELSNRLTTMMDRRHGNKGKMEGIMTGWHCHIG